MHCCEARAHPGANMWASDAQEAPLLKLLVKSTCRARSASLPSSDAPTWAAAQPLHSIAKQIDNQFREAETNDAGIARWISWHSTVTVDHCDLIAPTASHRCKRPRITPWALLHHCIATEALCAASDRLHGARHCRCGRRGERTPWRRRTLSFMPTPTCTGAQADALCRHAGVPGWCHSQERAGDGAGAAAPGGLRGSPVPGTDCRSWACSGAGTRRRAPGGCSTAGSGFRTASGAGARCCAGHQPGWAAGAAAAAQARADAAPRVCHWYAGGQGACPNCLCDSTPRPCAPPPPP